MRGLTRCFGSLTSGASPNVGLDIVSKTAPYVVSADEFQGSGDTRMSGKVRVVTSFEDFESSIVVVRDVDSSFEGEESLRGPPRFDKARIVLGTTEFVEAHEMSSFEARGVRDSEAEHIFSKLG